VYLSILSVCDGNVMHMMLIVVYIYDASDECCEIYIMPVIFG
jgi:hypothetical protein